MPRATPTKADLLRQVQELEMVRQQTQRALDALYRIGIACRGVDDPHTFLTTICEELRTIWAFDACYVALCDSTDTNHYRMALLVDGDDYEFIERAEIGTLTRHLLDHRRPLVMQDLVAERTQYGLPPATYFGSAKPSRAWMGVPLLIGQDALGVVSLQSYTVGVYSQADVELLARLGSSMAVALENATLSHRQGQLSRNLADQVALRNADLFVISDIAAMLTQQLPLASTFGSVLDFLLDALHVECGLIGTLPNATQPLLIARGTTASAMPLALGRAETAFGDAVRHGETVVINDAIQDQWPLIDGLEPFRSQLIVPLRRGNEVIGLALVGALKPHHFRLEAIELLQVVGNQLALALEHGLILQQRERQIAELAAMSRISYAASRALDTSTLLREIHDALQTVVPIDVFYMAIYDSERQVLTDSMAIEAGQEARYMASEGQPRLGSFTEWILNHKQTLFLRNVSRDIGAYQTLVPRTIIGQPSESWLGVPLIDTNDTAMGVISIQSYTPDAFSERDQAFLESVASQVGLHVRNVQLFRQRERQLAELNALQRISELISSTLDLAPMIHSIDEVLSSFLGVDAFFVALYDQATETLDGLFVLEDGLMQSFEHMVGQPIPAQTPTAWVIRNAMPLYFSNLDELGRTHPEIVPIQMTEPGACSWLGVPLMTSGGEALGAITVQSYKHNHFSERDQAFMLQLARQLTLAIQNARLFAERERQLAELDALQRISELITSTLELEPMLRSVDAILRSFMRADAFQVVIVNHAQDRVELAVVSEQGHDVQTHVVGKPLPEGTFISWTFRSGRPLRVANVYEDWQLYPGILEPRTADGRPKPGWLSIPLMGGDNLPAGVLAVRSYRENAFSERDERFLMSVGRQLALNIRNARLYAAEQTAHRTAETLREIARVLNTTFNPDEVLSLILRELRHVINYDSASVMLPSNGRLRIVARQSKSPSDDHWRSLQFDIDSSNGAGRVMLAREALIINDTANDAGWIAAPMTNSVRSWIGVPLISKGAVLGVLNINSLVPQAFSPQDSEIAMTFANQAATALEHARLYQESVTRVEQELEIAHQIQTNLFPKTLPEIPGAAIAAVCIPARETGGDFYDIVGLRDGLWALVVGDASGKSIPAAMLMAVARSITRSEARDHETPEAVMDETNRWISSDIPARSFVALAYATYDCASREIALANAGQLDPIRLNCDGELSYLVGPGPHLPLGIDAETRYETASFTLDPGDTLILYTDGVVEARNEEGEMWGFERLEGLIQTYAHDRSPQEFIEVILASITAFIGTYPQHDDMTVMVLQVDHDPNGPSYVG